MWRAFAIVCVFAFTTSLGQAQDNSPVPNTFDGILIIEPERLFSETLRGLQIQAELEKARDELIAENTRLEKELEAEERELADRRGTTPAEEFAVLAEAFDAKVVNIRAEQDEKQRQLTASLEAARQEFYNAILPVLAEVIRERRGVVVIERRMVFLAADNIDITDEVIARIDATLDAFTEE